MADVEVFDDECIHGLAPAFTCVLCRGKAERPEPPGPVFEARYEGYCPECGYEIERGELVRMFRDAAHHEECVSA